MGICYIAGAADTTRILKQSMIKNDDCVIAADGGYRLLQHWGIKPDQVVGDFDSLGYVPSEEHVSQYPSEKDDTDMMIAVKTGLSMGYRQFVILGGLGGRLDHTLANIHTLDYLVEHGARGCLMGDEENVLLIDSDSSITFRAEAIGRLSIFAYGGKAEGVYLTGLKYPLKDAVLTTDFPIGVSNEFTDRGATVSVRSGKLLVIWTGSVRLCDWI